MVVGAHDWIGNLVQNGAIDPVQLAAEQKAAFNETAIKAVTFNGQLYGVPYAQENLALIRNTDLAPEAPKTIEDLVATGKQLKAAKKATETLCLQVGQNGDAYHIYPLYTSAGGYLFGTSANGDYDPKDLGVGKPESIEAFKKIGALGEKGDGVLKRSIADTNSIATFTGKKCAFLVSGPWAMADVKKADITYDISADPRLRRRQGGRSRSWASRRSTSPPRARTRRWPRSSSPTTSPRPELAVALYKAEPAAAGADRRARPGQGHRPGPGQVPARRAGTARCSRPSRRWPRSGTRSARPRPPSSAAPTRPAPSPPPARRSPAQIK